MPWEPADTVWTIVCVIALGIAALAAMVLKDVRDARNVCVCKDSDDCTCGGAWGRRKL